MKTLKPVGRNDECPCGSNKKFKNCCLGVFPDEKIFYEKDVISIILEKSPQFKRYYEEKRKRIHNKLFWAIKRNSTPHIKCRNGTKPSGEHIIWLKEIPPKTIKPSVIAHEMEHIILVEEGYPYTFPRNTAINFSSFVNSLLQDPLIYRRLEKYDFDVKNDYIKNIEQLCEELGFSNSPQKAPTEELEKIKWILVYTQANLIKENLSIKEDICSFNELFNKYYKEIAEEGDRLIEVIQEMGFSTIEEQNELLKHILKKYNLESILFII